VKRGIHVALLQESKLTQNSKTPVFSPLRVDRPGCGGGGALLISVSKDIPFTHATADTLSYLPVDATQEVQFIRLRLVGKEISLVDVYVLPTSSCPAGHRINLSRLNTHEGTLVAGDFNAHDPT